MRILFLILLIAIVAGGWWATRRLAGEDDLAAVVVFRDETPLRQGDPVVLDGVSIGAVSAVEKRGSGHAIRIRVEGSKRQDVRSDSVWTVEQDAGRASLVLDNAVAVGRPVEEGATLRGGDDPTRRWVRRGREWFGQLAAEVERLANDTDVAEIERQFDTWTAKIPEWKEQGGAALDSAREQVEPRMRDLEQKLRETGRHVEAERVRQRLDEWLRELREEKKTVPAPSDEAA